MSVNSHVYVLHLALVLRRAVVCVEIDWISFFGPSVILSDSVVGCRTDMGPYFLSTFVDKYIRTLVFMVVGVIAYGFRVLRAATSYMGARRNSWSAHELR